MAIFAISDLHLALSIDKPMDVFGDRWSNYMEKIKNKWMETVTEDDYVIIPGDISWATYLEQAVEDFGFIESLPGKKIISKGNHDYWWTTLNKLEKFRLDNNFSSISFMHNNCFELDKAVVCGTRGWKCPGDESFCAEDGKIYNRELQRLEFSLKSVKNADKKDIIVAMHFPPFNIKGEPSDFFNIFKKHDVNICLYGHLHGECFGRIITGRIYDVDVIYVSADFLDFRPLKILE